jgi:plasmid stabilization system protein ParE
MIYRVLFHRLAERDLNRAYLWAAHRAPYAAALWLGRFQAKIASLANHPRRHGLAFESAKVRQPIRQLLFGRKPNVYRVLYLVDDTTVRVLRILRGQRRPLTRRELGEVLRPDTE